MRENEKTKRLPFELDIPGVPGYTIDPDMQVRSYLSGVPYLLKQKVDHSGCYSYNVWVYDSDGVRRRKTLSPLRLWLCAKAGVNPLEHTVDSFGIDLHGDVSVRYKHGGSSVTSVRVTASAADIQKDLLERSSKENDAQLRALASGDWSEVLLIMNSYRDTCISIVQARCRIRQHRAEAMFQEAVSRIQKQMAVYHRPVYSIFNRIIKEMRMMYRRGEVL